MLKVKYLKAVTSPSDRKGKVGDTRELPDRIAQRLAGEGYVKILDEKKQTPSTPTK